MRKNRRTNMKPTVAFRNFAKAPEKHSFPRTRCLKCFHAFVSKVLGTCSTNRQEKSYVNSYILELCLSEAKIIFSKSL